MYEYDVRYHARFIIGVTHVMDGSTRRGPYNGKESHVIILVFYNIATIVVIRRIGRSHIYYCHYSY